MRNFWHDLAYIGAFGALWALADSRLAPAVVDHDLVFLPAAQAALGVAVALGGRLVAPRRGAMLLMACVAVVLKTWYAGGLIFTATGRIVGAALWAEVALLALGKRDRAGFVAGGALAVLWTLAQPLLFAGLFAPKGLVVVYGLDVVSSAKLFHAGSLPAPALMALLTVAHALLGAAAGLFAWCIGAAGRLGRTRASVESGSVGARVSP